MCGLFGTVRPGDYPADLRLITSAAIDDLGYLAEERGIDSSGLALYRRSRRSRSRPAIGARGVGDRRVGPWRLVTTLGPYGLRMPSASLAGDVSAAQIVIGHTRAATQGLVNLDNASPMRVGALIGAHNGDVDIAVEPGQTDSQALLAALDEAETAPDVAAVMSRVLGRAALVWARMDDQSLLFLVRGAWSPLAVASDPAGAWWWASNPEWLRMVSMTHRLELEEPEMLTEGTVLQLAARDDVVEIVDQAEFTAVARPIDERLGPIVAWRGFSAEDELDDWDRQRHETTDLAPSLSTSAGRPTRGYDMRYR